MFIMLICYFVFFSIVSNLNDSQLHTFLLMFVMIDPLRALEESCVIYKSQSLTLCRLTHLPLV